MTRRATPTGGMWPIGGSGVRGELRPEETTRTLRDLVLEDDLLTALRRILREQEKSRELYAAGFAPTRKLLLHGPPGCGKTSTAEAIATALNLPLVRIDPAFVVRSHLGETGTRVSELFRAMNDLPGLWLFDELDAMAPDRENAREHAEMTRTVAALLTGLERWQGIGMIIACTNLIDALDRALFRRFDVVLGFGHPSSLHLTRIARRALGKLDMRAVDWHEVEQVITGRGAADVEAAMRRAAVDVILDGGAGVTTEQVISALRARHR